ncbi:MAG: toprim domain-containing protein [Desulfomonilaceae bacterium]
MNDSTSSAPKNNTAHPGIPERSASKGRHPRVTISQAGTFLERAIDQLRGAIPIPEALEHLGIEVNVSGFISCLHHSEDSPSMRIYEDHAYCFGCGKHLDLIELVRTVLNCSFADSLRWIAEQVGVEVPTLGENSDRAYYESLKVGELYARLFYDALKNEAVALKYLESRGISESVCKGRAGYLPADYFPQNEEEDEKFVEAGLISRNGNFLFADRIIFPITHVGRIVSIYGRAIDSERIPRHVYPANSIAEQPETVWNLDHCRKERKVMLSESIIDALSLEAQGYDKVIALYGTQSLSGERLDLIDSSDIQEITIVFDHDQNLTGQKAAMEVGKNLFSRGIGVSIKTLPRPDGVEKVDLNSYFKVHTREAFEQIAERSLVDSLLDDVPKDGSPEQKEAALEPLLKLLSTQSEITRESYVAIIKQRFPEFRKPVLSKAIEAQAKKLAEAASVDKVSPEPLEGEYAALFDGLVDLVEDDGQAKFLIVSENGELSIMDVAEFGERAYLPPPKDQIPWVLPRGQSVLKMAELEAHLSPQVADAALLDDLMTYHKRISELPGEEYYALLALWDLHTYVVEKFQYSPIILFFAVPERGKSRTGKGMLYLSFRGIHVESLRDAYVIRVADGFRATIFFDCKDLWKKAEKAGSEDMLLSRFERGLKVPRVLYPEKGPFQDTVYYSIFGATIVATNDATHRILSTRCLPISMPAAGRVFEDDVTPEDALPLKERLLLFRARHLHAELPKTKKAAQGRLGDIVRPLHQILLLVKPELEEDFLNLVKNLERARKTEKAESVEAAVLLAISSLENEVTNQVIPNKLITEAINKGRDEKSKLTPSKVGKTLASLGFKKRKNHDGNMAVLWDETLLRNAMESYGLVDES